MKRGLLLANSRLTIAHLANPRQTIRHQFLLLLDIVSRVATQIYLFLGRCTGPERVGVSVIGSRQLLLQISHVLDMVIPDLDPFSVREENGFHHKGLDARLRDVVLLDISRRLHCLTDALDLPFGICSTDLSGNPRIVMLCPC